MPYTKKIQFSIIFACPQDGNNDSIKWVKINYVFPPSVTPPTFKDIHNSFQALDTIHFNDVTEALGLDGHETTTSTGVTNNYSTLQELKSDILYYIK